MKSIQEVIKQSSFSSNYEMALVNIIYTANAIKADSAGVFKQYGILQQHYNILRIVNGRKGKPVSPGEIKEVILDKGRDITRLVDKMVALGLLVKQTDAHNGRQKRIFITKKGKQIVKEIREKMQEEVYQAPTISEEEARQLSHLLDKLRG